MAILYDTDWGDVLLRGARRMARVEAWVNRPGIRTLLITNIVLPTGLALMQVMWHVFQPGVTTVNVVYSLAAMALIWSLNASHVVLLAGLRGVAFGLLVINIASYYCGSWAVFLALDHLQSCVAAIEDFSLVQ